MPFGRVVSVCASVPSRLYTSKGLRKLYISHIGYSSARVVSQYIINGATRDTLERDTQGEREENLDCVLIQQSVQDRKVARVRKVPRADEPDLVGSSFPRVPPRARRSLYSPCHHEYVCTYIYTYARAKRVVRSH